jgi:hypothetical protein
MNDGDFLGLGCSALDPEAGQRFLRRLMRMSWESSSHAQLLLVDLARAGWDDADAVLRDVILEITNRGEPMPAFLASYNAWIVTGGRAPRTRGRKKTSNVFEDIVICVLVVELVVRFGLRPTRNLYAPRESACSIAAKVVRPMSEMAATKIWHRYGPAVVRGMIGWHGMRYVGA